MMKFRFILFRDLEGSISQVKRVLRGNENTGDRQELAYTPNDCLAVEYSLLQPQRRRTCFQTVEIYVTVSVRLMNSSEYDRVYRRER